MTPESVASMLYGFAESIGEKFDCRIYHPVGENDAPQEDKFMFMFFTATNCYLLCTRPDADGTYQMTAQVEPRKPRAGQVPGYPSVRVFEDCAVPLSPEALNNFLYRVVEMEAVDIRCDDFWRFHKLQEVNDPARCLLCGDKLSTDLELDCGVCDACVDATE